MKIDICEITRYNQTDFGGCDTSFTVTSRLVLNAEDGRISYTFMDVSPFTKSYGSRRTDFMEFDSDPNKMIFLAYVNDKLAGEVRIHKYWNNYALLADFVVDPKFRRQGVGRALIQRCVEWAGEKACLGITLETQDINVPACRLYESCGFTLRGFDTYLYKGLDPATDEIALYWYLMF